MGRAGHRAAVDIHLQGGAVLRRGPGRAGDAQQHRDADRPGRRPRPRRRRLPAPPPRHGRRPAATRTPASRPHRPRARGLLRGSAAEDCGSPSSSKVSIIRPGASGSVRCVCPPGGTFPCARKYSPEAAAPACASPGWADGSRPRFSSSMIAAWRSMTLRASAASGLQLGAQPLVVGPERPRLLAQLADLRLDPAEPRLRAPGPDLLGRVRPGDLRLDAALRRRWLAAAHAEPRGHRDQQDGGDDGEQQQLAAANRRGIAGIGAGAHRRPPAASVTATARRPPAGPVPGAASQSAATRPPSPGRLPWSRRGPPQRAHRGPLPGHAPRSADPARSR